MPNLCTRAVVEQVEGEGCGVAAVQVVGDIQYTWVVSVRSIYGGFVQWRLKCGEVVCREWSVEGHIGVVFSCRKKQMTGIMTQSLVLANTLPLNGALAAKLSSTADNAYQKCCV